MTDNETIKEFELFIKFSAPEKLLNDVLEIIKTARVEAIEEFAGRLRYISKLSQSDAFSDRLVTVRDINDLEEEMTAEASGNAEIKRLSDKNYKCIYSSDEETTEYCVKAICPQYKTEADIKAEARKEVFEKLISMCDAPHWCVWLSEICNLAEEMKVEVSFNAES